VRIETGAAESHESVLPLNSAASPGVQLPTPAFPSGTEQGGVRDLTGERLSQLAASAADISAAQAFGVSADGDRRGRYEASMKPLGASAGDLMDIPVVPSAAVPPAASDLYPYSGDEPVIAAAGYEDPAFGT
jgi:hypothetical protein